MLTKIEAMAKNLGFVIGGEFIAERLKCGTAGFRRLERSELAALSAVATTDLFVFFGFSWLFPNGDLLRALVLQQVPANND